MEKKNERKKITLVREKGKTHITLNSYINDI